MTTISCGEGCGAECPRGGGCIRTMDGCWTFCAPPDAAPHASPQLTFETRLERLAVEDVTLADLAAYFDACLPARVSIPEEDDPDRPVTKQLQDVTVAEALDALGFAVPLA